MNQELLDVKAGFRKGRRIRDQIANICWIIEKAREFHKNIYFCFIDYTNAFGWFSAIMVSVCLPSDALWQHLPSYLGFSNLGHGISLHCCSSKVQPLLLTMNDRYLLTTALPDLQCGIAPLGPPAPAQPRLLGCGVGPPGHRPCFRCGVAPPTRCPWPQAWGMG